MCSWMALALAQQGGKDFIMALAGKRAYESVCPRRFRFLKWVKLADLIPDVVRRIVYGLWFETGWYLEIMKGLWFSDRKSGQVRGWVHTLWPKALRLVENRHVISYERQNEIFCSGRICFLDRYWTDFLVRIRMYFTNFAYGVPISFHFAKNTIKFCIIRSGSNKNIR